MVHFPTVFGIMATLFLVLSYFVPDPWRAELLINAKYAILLLPLSAVGAVLSGLMDGRLRLKRLSTPVLKRKIAAAVLFSLSAIAMTMVWWVAGFSTAGIQIMILLGVLCQVFGIYLGRVGATLLGTSLPG